MLFSQLLFVCISIALILYATLFALFNRKIYSIQDPPIVPTILVLGAGLEPNGQPSDILKDRLISAQQLVMNAFTKYLVLSGAKKGASLSEPDAMKDYLQKADLAGKELILDEKGFSTFHSLVNLKKNGYPQPIAIISQRFHLTRALLIAWLLKLDCVGFAANNLSFSFQKTIFWYLREVIAVPVNLLKFVIYALGSYPDKS